MVERKALVLINGLLGSIPDGDSLNLPSLKSSNIDSDGYINFNISQSPGVISSDLLKLYYNSALCFNFKKLDILGEGPIGGPFPLLPDVATLEAVNGYKLKISASLENNLILSTGYGTIANTDRGGDLILDMGTPGAGTSSGAIVGSRRTGLLRITNGAAGDLIRLHRGQFGSAGGGALEFVGANYAPVGESGDPSWRIKLPSVSVIDLGNFSAIGGGTFYLNANTSGTVSARLRDVSGSFEFAPIVSAIVKPIENASAAGFSLTLGGGNSTFASGNGGNIIFAPGTPGSGGAQGNIQIAFNGTTRMTISDTALGSPGLGLVSNNSVDLGAVGTMFIRGLSLLRMDSANQQECNENGVIYNQRRYVSTALTTTGSQTIASIATTNDRILRIRDEVTWANDTDNTGGSHIIESVWSNIGGTLTQIGTTINDSAKFRSNDGGVSASTDFAISNSGANVVLSVNPTTVKNRTFRIRRVTN